MLFGPEALLELREDMMLAISSLSVVCRNIVYDYFHLKDSLKNVYVNILCFFCSFSYRGKVIIKGVSNTIGIDYSITIIKTVQLVH